MDIQETWSRMATKGKGGGPCEVCSHHPNGEASCNVLERRPFYRAFPIRTQFMTNDHLPLNIRTHFYKEKHARQAGIRTNYYHGGAS
jgi:hypothetical protein